MTPYAKMEISQCLCLVTRHDSFALTPSSIGEKTGKSMRTTHPISGGYPRDWKQSGAMCAATGTASSNIDVPDLSAIDGEGA